VSTQALLVEALLSGFFAVACIRARAESPGIRGLAPQRLLVLTSRLERLRKTRWQWCSMVVLLILIRIQSGAPLVAEFTVLAQFMVFMALPSQKKSPQGALAKKQLREALRRS
jgi:hypothetical protein